MRRGADLPASRPGSSKASEHPAKPASQSQRPVEDISVRVPRRTLGQRRPSLRRLSGQVETPPPSIRVDPAKTGQGPKSPAYLRGKNPYGKILDSIDHSYREQKPSAPGPPSQVGSTLRGRPRTSGTIKFVTRPVPQSSTERAAPAVTPPTPLLPLISPPVSLSVKDAKSFFESKASGSRKHPSQLATSHNAPSKTNARELSSQHNSSLRSGPNAAYPAHQSRMKRDGSDPTQCVPGPSEVLSIPAGTAESDPQLKADDVAPLAKTNTTALVDNDCSNSHTIAVWRTATRDYRSAALSRRRRRQACRSAPMESGHNANESVQRSRGISIMSKPQDTDSIETSVHEFGEPPSRDLGFEEIAAKGFSYDGSMSHHDPAHHSPACAADFSANIGVEEGYDSVEVPDHIDCRSGYGRRRSEDFGFPGARIKPGSTRRSSKVPLQDPSNWIKRSCGHFSTISSIERREEASKKPCSQCRNTESPRSLHSRHQRTRRRAATDTSTGTLQDSEDPRKCRPKRRQHRSECAPVDRCGDTFAQDLGYVIDSILEEHQNTLQHVINNIKYSQPNLAQLRRVSEDLIHRCRSGCDTPARPQTYQCFVPCRHVCQSCQPVCQPMQPCQPVQQACNQQSCCPYVPPKAVEKLNVGSPGQLGLNLNDSHASLRDGLRTGPDLVDLVKSAADNLGMDLDQRPSSADNAKFEEAPVEGSPQSSVLLHARPAEDHEVDLVEDDPEASKDEWLQRTRRQLSELSETRSQLMGELDTIAEDLGVHLEDYDRDPVDSDPVKRVLSKASTILSKR